VVVKHFLPIFAEFIMEKLVFLRGKELGIDGCFDLIEFLSVLFGGS
jgi:hypothetical protein